MAEHAQWLIRFRILKFIKNAGDVKSIRMYNFTPLIRPNMGKLMALRNNYHQISYNTAVDEAIIEPFIFGQGLRYLQSPVAIVFNRRKSRSDFAGNANYSYCAIRDLKYFVYKLVTICTVNSLPVV